MIYAGYTGDPKNDWEVFQFVKTHLLTQSKKAVDCDGNCQYRAPGGLMCAVGCLIPDAHYDPEWEGTGVYCDSGSLVRDYLAGRGFNCKLLVDLQSVHDDYEVDDWPERLDAVEEDFFREEDDA